MVEFPLLLQAPSGTGALSLPILQPCRQPLKRSMPSKKRWQRGLQIKLIACRAIGLPRGRATFSLWGPLRVGGHSPRGLQENRQNKKLLRGQLPGELLRAHQCQDAISPSGGGRGHAGSPFRIPAAKGDRGAHLMTCFFFWVCLLFVIMDRPSNTHLYKCTQLHGRCPIEIRQMVSDALAQRNVYIYIYMYTWSHVVDVENMRNCCSVVLL